MCASKAQHCITSAADRSEALGCAAHPCNALPTGDPNWHPLCHPMQVLHGEALSPVSQAVYKLVALVLYRRSHFITLVRTPGDALGVYKVGNPGAAQPSMYQLVDDDRVTDITSLASAGSHLQRGLAAACGGV